MESLYQQALSLYNQGDYEGTFDLLYGETDRECILLAVECKRLLTDQYVYLIKDALEQKEYAEARRLKETFLSKFGSDTTINAFQIPDGSLEAALKEEVPSYDLQEVNPPLRETSKSKSLYIIVVGILFLSSMTYLLLENQGFLIKDKIVDISDKVIENVQETSVRELFLEGNKDGKPITMQLTINAKGEIEGIYKDVLNDLGFTLSGNENAGDWDIKGSNRNLMFQCDLSQVSKHSYRGYIRFFEDLTSADSVEKISIYLSNWLTNEIRSQLQSLTYKWNNTHTLNENDLLELHSLYADQVFFYGQTLDAGKCIKLIRQTIEKYDTYNQMLVGDISFTILDDGLVKCGFTKRVAVNGKSKDYEAYLIFKKLNDRWIIQTESDNATDAYFERLRKKEIK